MKEVLNKDILEEFTAITQYPIDIFIIDFNSFIREDLTSIVGFYSGDTTTLNSKASSRLESLNTEIQNIFSVIALNSKTFTNFKWWELIDGLELMENTLLKLNSASRWLRSSITNSSYNPNPEVKIPLNQGQTLESVQRNTLGSDDWENTWQDTALKNDLREEDYTSEGGILLKANFNYSKNNFKLQSIVDNQVDNKILGVDLDKKIQIDQVDQDFLILDPPLTFKQTIEILINLRKGDNPEFPDQGISPNLIVGSNVNSLSYPSLFRQLTTLFGADDTIKSFSLVNISRSQDGVFIDFECESRLGDLQNISLKI